MFAERLISFSWAVKSSSRVASLSLPADLDETVQEAVLLQLELLQPLLIFLRKIYLGDTHQTVSAEFSNFGNGIWSLETDVETPHLRPVDKRESMPLFPALCMHLREFSCLYQSWPLHCVQAFCHSLTHVVLPLIRDYYEMPNFVVPERSVTQNVHVAREMWDVLHLITNSGSELMERLTQEESAELRATAFSAMNSMVQNGTVAQATITETPDSFSGKHSSDSSFIIADCLRAGFKAFRSEVATRLRENEQAHVLPLLLSTDEEADIYNDLTGSYNSEADLSPKISTILIELIPVLHSEAEDQILIDLLSLLRGTMYLSDPLKDLKSSNDLSVSLVRARTRITLSGDPDEEVRKRWHLFTGFSSVVKAQENDRALLSWVQAKFDALGCVQGKKPLD